MTLAFKEERDSEFFDICMRIKQGSDFTVPEVVEKAINTPASSFFLTHKAYDRILKHSGDIKGVKKELYKEIKSRFENTGKGKLCERYDKLDECTAPKFYMSVARGTSLYYELVKKHNNEVHNRINFYNRVFGV